MTTFLLPQERAGTVERVQPLDIHSDHYLDLTIRFDDEPFARVGRMPTMECPAGLAAGMRVRVHFVMGVMTKVAIAEAPPFEPGEIR